METFLFKAQINVPVQNIDLYEWLLNISENDYKSFSKGHRAIGKTVIDGVESMINVERIGGNLLVQHYKILQKQKDNVFLHSAKSDAYLFHFIKVKVGVVWKMSVLPKDANSSDFICEIGVKYPNPLLKIASFFVAGNYFLQKHINEEGLLFAKNIESGFRK